MPRHANFLRIVDTANAEVTRRKKRARFPKGPYFIVINEDGSDFKRREAHNALHREASPYYHVEPKEYLGFDPDDMDDE